jgi:phosphinothricin acetyltransferase
MAVRIAKVEDIPTILAIYAPYVEETAYTFEYTVPTMEEFTLRFQTITKQFPWLVWEEEGKVLGYAYACAPFERAAFAWCAEPAIYLCPEACGKGIGRKLYAALEQLLQAQGYKKVYAIITTANEPSVAFHKAVGYRHTATMPGCGYKLGNWYGIVWMEKDLNAWETPPHEPNSIGKIRKQ